ncbi:MAG: linear amide C-N hydrolase, partial [Planctomycetes bacterium]|nr:linear amide C-N hydrolase [Planctomycetota bacterium]
MMNFTKWLFFSMLFFGLAQGGGMACTTFQLDHSGQILVGKNYDYMVEDGLIIVNKRGVLKTAMRSIMDNTGVGQPAQWTSKYGSITVNQYGREVPTGGMNEAGLVVESMMLRSTIFPPPDSRPSILLNQWMQYQLDNFAGVDEVIASDAQLRIRPRKGSGL